MWSALFLPCPGLPLPSCLPSFCHISLLGILGTSPMFPSLHLCSGCPICLNTLPQMSQWLTPLPLANQASLQGPLSQWDWPWPSLFKIAICPPLASSMPCYTALCFLSLQYTHRLQHTMTLAYFSIIITLLCFTYYFLNYYLIIFTAYWLFPLLQCAVLCLFYSLTSSKHLRPYLSQQVFKKYLSDEQVFIFPCFSS